MELDRYKAAWQHQPMEGHSLPSLAHVSRSLHFLRTSAVRDLQRSDELLRLIFGVLFALLVIGASLMVLPPGAGRIEAWLLAAALLVDGVAGMVLLSRRLHGPSTTSMLEFIRKEHRQVETRLQLERYSQWVMFILAAIALLVAIFTPRPIDLRESALDALGRVAVVTALLAVAWRRAKLRSKEIRRELERHLRDLTE